MKRKWYENLLLAIGRLICFFRGHEWVNALTYRYCKCCGKIEELATCANCHHFHITTKWCRLHKKRIKYFPCLCSSHLKKEKNHG